MRRIDKPLEPPTVEQTRCASTTDLSSAASARTAFDQVDKKVVRVSLAREQGWLCAFCMRRIKPEALDERGEPTMKIAHRTPISTDPRLALTWNNLLGSCDGGQRSAGRYWTCDAAQGPTPLTVDPTNASSVGKLTYERRGDVKGLFITSSDPSIRQDVEETLNLNAHDLRVARQAIWDAFTARQRKAHPQGPYGRDGWRAYLPKWRAEHGERLPEYCGVVEAKAT